MQTQLGAGNHTIWVRAVSSEGISAPLTIPLNVGEAQASKSEDTPGFSTIFTIAAISIALATVAKRKTHQK